jgi:Ca-activated chloride channel family protein
MLNRLPSGTEAAATKVFTIAYGDDAEVELLQTIANRINALWLTGTEKNIAEIYLTISSYFQVFSGQQSAISGWAKAES